jgi:hypothetical protein
MSYPEPKYPGATGEISAVLRRAGQPYNLEIGHGGTQVHYLATGAATRGEFGLYRWDFTGSPSGPKSFVASARRPAGGSCRARRPGTPPRQTVAESSRPP